MYIYIERERENLLAEVVDVDAWHPVVVLDPQGASGVGVLDERARRLILVYVFVVLCMLL